MAQIEAVQVESVSTRPEADSYHTNTGGITSTHMCIRPSDRSVLVYQREDTGVQSPEKYHQIVIDRRINESSHPPDKDALEVFLESEEGQAHLAAICDGHREVWDGHNTVGRLSSDAEEHLAALLDEIDHLPQSDWTMWAVSEWLCDWAGGAINADTTDEAIKTMAAECEVGARKEHVVLDGDVEDYLRERRQELRDDAGWRVCNKCQRSRPNCVECNDCDAIECKDCREGWELNNQLRLCCPRCPEVVFISANYFDQDCGDSDCNVCNGPNDEDKTCPAMERALRDLVERCQERFTAGTPIKVMRESEMSSEIAAQNYRFVEYPPDGWYEDLW